MGGGGVPRGGPPNQAAYYVALAGIAVLLCLLCFYFCYFVISKVKELSEQETPSTTPSTAHQRAPSSYPVQPVIRDSATAMAKLCKELPASGGKGDTVFPTSTSPAALRTAAAPAGGHAPPPPAPPAGAALCVRDKIGPPPVAHNTVSEAEVAR